jgi:hypothetical protein
VVEDQAAGRGAVAGPSNGIVVKRGLEPTTLATLHLRPDNTLAEVELMVVSEDGQVRGL